MKKLLTAIGGLVAAAMLAGAAYADGMPRYSAVRDAPLPPPPPTWSGFYLGAGLGYGQAVLENDYRETGPVFQHIDGEGMSGGFGTVIIGYDKQIRGKWVIGAFADFDWSSIELDYNDNVLGPQSLEIDWTWAVGGRIGYLLNPGALLYVSGGYTQVEFDSNGFYDILDDFGVTHPGKSPTHDGFFVGVGLEALLTKNFFLRGEMRYSQLSDEIINASSDGVVSWEDKVEPRFWTGRLVLTYKFPRERHIEPVPMK